MKVNSREKKLLCITVAAGVTLAGYRLAVAPLLAWRQQRTSGIRELQARLAEYRGDIRQKAIVDEQYDRIAADLRQKGSNEEQIVRLLQDVRKKYSGLPLIDKGTRVPPVEEGSFYRKFRIAVDLEGTVPALADFLHNIATADEPLRIEELAIRAVTTDRGRASIQASILISSVVTSPASQSKE